MSNEWNTTPTDDDIRIDAAIGSGVARTYAKMILELRAELAEARGRCDDMRAAIDALVNDSHPARNDDGDYLVPGRLVDNAAALAWTAPAEPDARGTTGE